MKKSIFARTKTIIFAALFCVLAFYGYRIFFRSPKHDFSHYNLQAVLEKQNVIPVAVVGSGPAGLSAALYGARGGFYTMVFEGSKPGGQLMTTSWVENWPGMPKKMGPDLIKSLRDQAKEFGAAFMQDTVTEVDFGQWPFVLKTESGKTVNALTVIIATGAAPRLLNIPGEQEYWGTGVTTCAICDAPFFKEKEVIVVGGGDSAAEEAMQLAPYAKKITVFVRGESMRASAAMQDRLKAYEHIAVSYKSKLFEIKGDGKHVTNAEAEINGEKKNVKVDGVFLAIGHIPNSQVFKNYISVNKFGFVDVLGHSQHTTVPGVYAAGDVADHKYRQAGIAAGDGIKAALDASDFLREVGYNEDFAKKLETQLFVGEGGVGREPLKNFDSMKAFNQRSKETKLPIFLDFYTEFCPSCVQMLPVIETLAAQLKDQMEFYKVDAVKVQELAERYQVEGVPAFIIVKDGELVARAQGSMKNKEIKAFLQAALG